MNISEELRNDIIQYLNDYRPEFDYDCQFELSIEQISFILEHGTDKLWEVENDIREANIEGYWELENWYITECISSFEDDLLEELNLEYIDDIDISEFKDEFSEHIHINDNLYNRIQNTDLRLNITFAEFCYAGYMWRSHAEYEDLEYILKVLQINPSTFNENWPNINYGKPVIMPVALKEILDNSTTGYCDMTFCVSMTLGEYLDNPSIANEITIGEGTYLTMWDRLNGSASIEYPTIETITLDEHSIVEDRCSNGWGLDEICGLSADYWKDNVILQ